MATPTTDLKFNLFRALGFTGALADMELQWLQDNGATSDNLSDAWIEYLAAELASPTGVRLDDWFALLRETYTGSMSDMENEFWQAAVDALP